MSGTVWPQVVLSNASGVPYDSGTPLPVTGSFSATTSAKATAAAPSYVEGSSNQLSTDLAGALRISGSINATSAATATAAAPSYTEGTSNALSQTLTGDQRVIAKQSGTWTVTGAGGTFPVTGTFWQATQPVSIAATVAASGTFWQATQPISAAASAIAAGAGVDGWDLTQGAKADAAYAGSGSASVIAALKGIYTIAAAATPAGANLIGKVGIDQTTAGTTNGVVENATSASGGISTTARLLSAAASTNGTNAKASAGRLYSIQGYNAATAVRYLKLYNKASSPTVGTDTPVKTLALPPGAGFAFDWPVGYSFATGISFGLTTGSADNDTGALTAGDVLGLNLDYV
jgi:hypothetical protein